MTGNDRKRDPSAVRIRLLVFGILAGAILLLAVLAPLLAPSDPLTTHVEFRKVAPCAQFPLGTDDLGRCVLSRVMWGASTSVFSSLALVAVSFVLGTVLGIVCGWYGGVLDEIVMRVADVFLSFPQMVLAIAVAGILGGSLFNAMLALGITGWTLYARLARSSVMSLKSEPFIAAARYSGLRGAAIMARHLLPNIAGPLLVNAATQIGTTMIGIAGLSFLGIGVTPPTPEWGSMISDAKSYMRLAPWAVMAPAAAVIVTVMVYNFFGDSLRDWMEVKGRQRRADAAPEIEAEVADKAAQAFLDMPGGDLDMMLEVSGLSLSYGETEAVSDINFCVPRGSVLAVLGESGSGKSTLLKSIMDPALFGVSAEGSIVLGGRELVGMPDKERRKLRGRKICMIFQDPGGSFHPLRSYRKQLKEMLKDLGLFEGKASYEKMKDAFAKLGLSDGERILKSSPYQMSGGMNQRIAIAAAMLLEPELLLLDEPTSALDVTTQMTVLGELESMHEQTGMTMLIVTHNPGVALKISDYTAVMYKGRLVEFGPTEEVLHQAKHWYTRSLVAAIPKMGEKRYAS